MLLYKQQRALNVSLTGIKTGNTACFARKWKKLFKTNAAYFLILLVRWSFYVHVGAMFPVAGSFLDPDLLVRLPLMVMGGGKKKKKRYFIRCCC